MSSNNTTAIVKAHIPTFNFFNNMVFILIALIGLIIKMFFTNDYSEDGLTGPASSNLWGYGVITFGLLGMLLIYYSKQSQHNINRNSINFVINIFKSSI